VFVQCRAPQSAVNAALCRSTALLAQPQNCRCKVPVRTLVALVSIAKYLIVIDPVHNDDSAGESSRIRRSSKNVALMGRVEVRKIERDCCSLTDVGAIYGRANAELIEYGSAPYNAPQLMDWLSHCLPSASQNYFVE